MFCKINLFYVLFVYKFVCLCYFCNQIYLQSSNHTNIDIKFLLPTNIHWTVIMHSYAHSKHSYVNLCHTITHQNGIMHQLEQNFQSIPFDSNSMITIKTLSDISNRNINFVYRIYSYEPPNLSSLAHRTSARRQPPESKVDRLNMITPGNFSNVMAGKLLLTRKSSWLNWTFRLGLVMAKLHL